MHATIVSMTAWSIFQAGGFSSYTSTTASFTAWENTLIILIMAIFSVLAACACQLATSEISRVAVLNNTKITTLEVNMNSLWKLIHVPYAAMFVLVVVFSMCHIICYRYNLNLWMTYVIDTVVSSLMMLPILGSLSWYMRNCIDWYPQVKAQTSTSHKRLRVVDHDDDDDDADAKFYDCTQFTANVPEVEIAGRDGGQTNGEQQQTPKKRGIRKLFRRIVTRNKKWSPRKEQRPQ